MRYSSTSRFSDRILKKSVLNSKILFMILFSQHWRPTHAAPMSLPVRGSAWPSPRRQPSSNSRLAASVRMAMSLTATTASLCPATNVLEEWVSLHFIEESMKCQISADLRRHVLHEELLQCRNQSEFWVHEWRILRGGQECVRQNGEDRVQVSWKLKRAWGSHAATFCEISRFSSISFLPLT